MLYGKTNETYVNIKLQTALVQVAMVLLYINNQPRSLAGHKKISVCRKMQSKKQNVCADNDILGKKMFVLK